MTMTRSLDAHHTQVPYTKMPFVSNINSANTVLPTKMTDSSYIHITV